MKEVTMALNSIRNIGSSEIKPIGVPGVEKSSNSDFRAQLDSSIKNIDKLKFSGHALDRLADRKVVLTEDKTERLLRAVDAAETKGSKDSLVLLDELAFVVSVKNRTVITACDTSSLKEGVFTKIDSAVLG
jgi:flagellar operon protein